MLDGVVHHLSAEGFAGEAVNTHAWRLPFQFRPLRQLAQIAGREGGHGDAFVDQAVVGFLHAPQGLVPQDNAGAMAERGQPALVGAVEADGQEVKFPVLRGQAIAGADGLAVHGQAAVGDGHALGLTGGAGGVDQVRELFRMNRYLRY